MFILAKSVSDSEKMELLIKTVYLKCETANSMLTLFCIGEDPQILALPGRSNARTSYYQTLWGGDIRRFHRSETGSHPHYRMIHPSLPPSLLLSSFLPSLLLCSFHPSFLPADSYFLSISFLSFFPV